MTRLEEIKARCEKATPGPWSHDCVQNASAVICGHKPGLVVAWRGDAASFADAAFIASARSDVPWLVSEVERLRSGLELVASIVESSEADDADILVAVGREVRAVLKGNVR